MRLVWNLPAGGQGRVCGGPMGSRSFGTIILFSVLESLSGAEVPVESQSSHYFARGFDLEEGAEFAYRVDGIPLNLPSALQGPGFMDDGLLIPETCGAAVYRKGPYAGDQGPFAIAGSADLETVAAFVRPMARITYGGAAADRYGRLLWAQSPARGVACALEVTRSYRPWDQFWPSARINGFLKAAPVRGWTCTLLATEDQGDGGSPPPDRPLPADHQEDFDDLRLGNGYHFKRAFLGLSRSVDRGQGVTDRFRFHGGASSLRNWVNGTYALAFPQRGDQQELLDRRTFIGFEASRRWDRRSGGEGWVHTLGAQGRLDAVSAAEVYATRQRERWLPLMAARGELLHTALHGQSTFWQGEAWRAFFAARVDSQRHHVHGASPWTPQDRLATLVSPRVGLAWTPWTGAGLQASFGQGFRPGNAFRDTRPLIRSRQADLALRARVLGPWETSLTLWGLDLEHESLWDARAGAPLLSGPSRRQGLEWFHGFSRGHWHGEASLGWSRARFLHLEPGLDRVPGAIPQTAVLELGWDDGRFALGITFKRLGAYALTPDNSLVCGRRDTLQFSLKRHWQDWSAGVKVLNAFNLRRHTTGYFYESQLPGEPWSVEDTHTKHGDPQAIRLELTRRF